MKSADGAQGKHGVACKVTSYQCGRGTRTASLSIDETVYVIQFKEPNSAIAAQPRLRQLNTYPNAVDDGPAWLVDAQRG